MQPKIIIKHRYTDAVLFEYEPTDEQKSSGMTMCAALEAATKDGANLRGANLDGKKLVGDRPVFIAGPIGSRSDYFTAYLTDKGVHLRTGCFFGAVDEFAEKLIAEHGDNEHAQEYAAALALIACHARLWTPGQDEEKSTEAA